MKLSSSQAIFKSSLLDTPLGNMIAICDDDKLHLLEFTDRRGLEHEIERLRIKTGAVIIPEKNSIIAEVGRELGLYFQGKLKHFTVKLAMKGSPFQQMAWNALIGIPYGHIRSYLEQAQMIGKETAFRAVANANGANPIAIIIPCHRIINTSGKLGGYGGGIHRKEWLINHEKSNLREEDE